MPNNNFEQNNEQYSDAYLADKRTSEQYAEAARKANSQANMNHTTNHYRRVSFEQSGHDVNAEAQAMQGEAMYRNIEQAASENGTDFDTNTNAYDLADLEQAESYSPQSVKQSRYSGDRLQNTNSSRAGYRRSPAAGKIWQDISNGIRQTVFLLFSKRPMQSFHLNLHWATLGVFAFFNILFVGILNTVLYSKIIQTLTKAINLQTRSNGSVFGISLLSQLVTLLLLVLLLIGMSFLLKSESRSLKQFFQTTMIATVPYTFILLLSIVVSFFAPIVGTLIALAGKIQAYIFLYAGFQKGHPTKKNSPFWIFIISIFLVLILQYYFINWALV